MSRDLLERATEALREERGGASDEAGATLARILGTSRRARRAKTRHVWIALPLAATLVATVAWAGGTGRLRRELDALFTSHEPEAPVAAPSSLAPAPAQSAPVEPSAPVESAAPSASDPTIPAVAHPAPKIVRSASPTVRAPVESPGEDALYRDAHEAHFARKDYAAAVAAWERYLAVAPNGPLSIEARYNRAIAFVRLNRAVEARAALEPFAKGEYGAYRQAEARALLEMLDRREQR